MNIIVPFNNTSKISNLLGLGKPIEHSPLFQIFKDSKKHTNCKIIFDSSLEGRNYNQVSVNTDTFIFNLNMYSEVEKICIKLDVNLSNVIFITANQLVNNEGKIKTISYNKLLSMYDLQYKFKNAHRTKHFVCLNNQIRPHRLILTDCIITDGLLDKSYYSFRFPKKETDINLLLKQNHQIVNKDEFKYIVNKYKTYNDITIEETIKPKLCYLDNNDNKLWETPEYIWNNSCINVVTETQFTNDSLFITEKTFRCLDVGLPFIMFGSTNTIKYLRDTGFDVFDDIVCHDYDNEIDNKIRFSMAYEQLKKICNTDINKLNIVVNGLEKRVQYNRDVLKKLKEDNRCDYV